MNTYQLITVLGPTASGKTSFAAALVSRLSSEIISADSRQVYRSMDIGTGKDLSDYIVNDKKVPYHLIDICDPGYKYNVFQYQHDFFRIYQEVKQRVKYPILCGGTGMYIEAVLKAYKLLDVPENPSLRESLKGKTLKELESILSSYKVLHGKKDVDSAQRAIRAIEIEEFYKGEEPGRNDYEPIDSLIVGIDIDRELRRQKISTRLKARLEEGMVDEVKSILASGVKPEDLIYYGLEYKFLTLYVIGELSYDEMVSQLEIAIHQFAKRQMTWFRGMERRGCKINWMDASLSLDDKIGFVEKLLNENNR